MDLSTIEFMITLGWLMLPISAMIILTGVFFLIAGRPKN